MNKHSIIIFGHKTSLSLENEFWDELKKLAQEENISLTKLIEKIDGLREGNLSSSIRIYILKTLKNKVINDKESQ